MRLETGKFFGVVSKQVVLDNFNLTLTTYAPQCTIARHHHQSPYLSLLLEGSYKETSKANEQIVSRGNTLFRPGDYEHMNTFANSHGKCFNIEIKQETCPFFAEGLKKPSEFFFNHSSVELYKLLQNLSIGTGPILNDLTFELCSDLFVQQANNRHGRALWIKKVMDFIQDNPAYEHSIKEIAAVVNIHPVYLVRKFKEKTGYKLTKFYEGLAAAVL